MKITIGGNFAALVGFIAGAILADLGGAMIWQEIIAGTAFAIAIVIIFPGATE